MAKILIIDDDYSIRELYKYILTELGHLVETAKDGRDGLAKVRTLKPDCLLLDIDMPEMTEHELAREQSKSLDPALRNIPFLVLTGGSVIDLSLQYRFQDNSYCKAFLPKMSSPELVAKKIREILLPQG